MLEFLEVGDGFRLQKYRAKTLRLERTVEKDEECSVIGRIQCYRM